MSWKQRRCWLIPAVLAASAWAAAVAGNVSAQTSAAPLDPAGCSNGTWEADRAWQGPVADLVSDCIALVAVRNHFKSIPANASLEWNTPWKGTRVNPDGRPVLDLSNNQLSGAIPPELGKLTNLHELQLYDNNLSGAIPPELGKLTNLRELRLYGNNLSGAIPAELGNLANLQDLRLYGINLSGAIPPELGKLTNIQNLHLDLNGLSGAIPPELGKLANLQDLRLYRNNLSGAIPAELGKLTNLQNLRLGANGLSGAIPAELGKLTSLLHLGIFGNELSGTIPAELGKLTNLQTLHLGTNSLSGTIPAELGKLTNLQTLRLYNNDLYGAIPPEFSNLTNLQLLRLDDNDLSGAIPAELGKLTNLQFLRLSGNGLYGAIPAELGKLTNLQFLRLDDNELSGAIPAELGKLTNLEMLRLSGNDLSGAIPAELGKLTNLQHLLIQDNRLSGEIPNTLRASLSFGFCNNQLTGPLPSHLHHTAFGGDVDVNDISGCWDGTFRDDDNNAHRRNIEQIAAWGITQGCDQDRFCPSRTVNRAQMAAFLHRAAAHLHGEPGSAGEAPLTDVDPDAWYNPYAQWAVAHGVIRAPGGAFNPQGAVTRADMAEMLVAAFDHLSASPEFQGLFSDVAGIPPAAVRAMEGIHDAGVTTGCGTAPLRYCPTEEVTRAQMASFLVRAVNLASGDS